MMVASEADDAWWPPTFSPSTLSRRWLALWMDQLASHSNLRSSSPRMARSVGEIEVVWLYVIGKEQSTGFPAQSLDPRAQRCPSCLSPHPLRNTIGPSRERQVGLGGHAGSFHSCR